MTDEEINRVIAEICGWKIHPANRNLVTDPKYPHSVQPIGTIPDYCNDLNAMHEAERVLTFEQLFIYAEWLESEYGNFGVRATAHQRSEALLRTLGKWEEAK